MEKRGLIKKPAIALALILLLGAGGYLSFAAFVSGEEDIQDNDEVLPLVDAKEVKTRDLEKIVTLSGNVEPSDQRAVIPQMGGEVNEIYVEAGDDVEKGDPLMSLDEEDYRLQQKEAEAALKAAKANLDEARAGARDSEVTEAETGVKNARENKKQAKNELERITALHEEEFATDQQLEQAEMQYENAKSQLESQEAGLEAVKDGAREEQIDALEAQVNQAETAVQMARRTRSNALIESPSTGRVVLVEVSEGEMAGTGSPAFMILDRDSLQVTATLPPAYVNNAEVGDIVEVSIPAVSEEIYEREVQRIGELPPEGNRSYPMEVILPNPDGEFKAGMYAQVNMIFEYREDVLTVPRHSLVDRNDEMGIYTVASDDTIEFKSLEFGISEEGVLEVTEGLSGDELIVTDGQAEVLPGEEVRVNIINGGNDGGDS